jgi:uncharacterized phage protein (TIGR01671 family)
MRDIKFRAWTRKGMVTPAAWVNDESLPCYSLSGAPLKPLMQYTGLTDKNGVEIYEGDIVRHWSYGYNDGGMGNKQVLSVVEWDEFGACFENCIDRRNGVEVVGNIYENPELLED